MATSDYPDNNDPKQDDVIRMQAVNWLLRQRDGSMGADEWNAFSDWLASDERHGVTFDELVAADTALHGMTVAEDAIEEDVAPFAANDNPKRRFAAIWGGGVAAALIGAIVLLGPLAGPEFRHLETSPGEQREIALQGGVTMALNGATEVEVAEDEPTVRFARGEAAFEIVGEAPSALRIEVADLVLTDHGTVFNVILDEHSLRVAVAEGAVQASSEAGTWLIEAGQQLEKPLDGNTLIRRQVDNEAVMSWRDGRLEFANTPVTQVAADVGRNLGRNITISDRLADERLTGSIGFVGDEEQVLSDLAALLGGQLRRGDDGWRID